MSAYATNRLPRHEVKLQTQQFHDIDFLFDQLTVGTRELTTLNEAAYVLPVLHGALYQKHDETMNDDNSTDTTKNVQMREIRPRKIRMGSRCKTRQKKTEKCEKRRNVAIKTKSIRGLRKEKNNAKKSLNRSRRRKIKEDKNRLAQLKRRCKTAMKNLKIRLESFKL